MRGPRRVTLLCARTAEVPPPVLPTPAEPLCTRYMDFVCKNRQQCLFHSMVCDGIIQCRDGSDEDANYAGCCKCHPGHLCRGRGGHRTKPEAWREPIISSVPLPALLRGGSRPRCSAQKSEIAPERAPSCSSFPEALDLYTKPLHGP